MLTLMVLLWFPAVLVSPATTNTAGCMAVTVAVIAKVCVYHPQHKRGADLLGGKGPGDGIRGLMEGHQECIPLCRHLIPIEPPQLCPDDMVMHIYGFVHHFPILWVTPTAEGQGLSQVSMERQMPSQRNQHWLQHNCRTRSAAHCTEALRAMTKQYKRRGIALSCSSMLCCCTVVCCAVPCQAMLSSSTPCLPVRRPAVLSSTVARCFALT